MFNGPTITPWTIDACLVGLALMNTNTPSAANVVDQNQAYYVPFHIFDRAYVAKQMFASTGTTGTGHFDLGIYDSQGNRLVSSGSTAHGATTGLQMVNITDTTLQPGQYWMAFVSDSATDTFTRATPSFQAVRGLFIRTQASAFTLPDPATFAIPTVITGLPMFGLTNRTF